MTDPSLLVTNPTTADPHPGAAGPARLLRAGADPEPRPPASTGPSSARATGTSWSPPCEARGYAGFGAAIEVERLVTPADWAASGLAAGAPFAAAHTFAQTGPFRPPTWRAGWTTWSSPVGHPARRGRADGAALRAARGRTDHRPRSAAIAVGRPDQAVGRRGQAVGRRGEAVGRRGEAVGRRGEAVGRRGEAVGRRGQAVGRPEEAAGPIRRSGRADQAATMRADRVTMGRPPPGWVEPPTRNSPRTGRAVAGRRNADRAPSTVP